MAGTFYKSLIMKNRIKKTEFLPYILIAPAFLLIFLFFFYPFINNFYNSFISEGTVSKPSYFVGLDNYIDVLSNEVFYQSLYNTLIWTVGVTLFQFLLGFITALISNKQYGWLKAIRPLYILPWAIPGIVAALAWRWIYNADYGILNSLLFRIGVLSQYHGWLVSPNTAMLSVMMVGVWKGYPFYMMMLYAGLQGIPLELYEAAKIDGANRIQLFKNITLPQLRPIIVMSLTLGLIWTSNYFEGIYVLTGGGPARTTETLPIFIYNTAFSYFRIHDAVIPSVIFFFIILFLASLYVLMIKRRGELKNE